jgi:Ca2+-binding EF-hand superfamily protein
MQQGSSLTHMHAVHCTTRNTKASKSSRGVRREKRWCRARLCKQDGMAPPALAVLPGKASVSQAKASVAQDGGGSSCRQYEQLAVGRRQFLTDWVRSTAPTTSFRPRGVRRQGASLRAEQDGREGPGEGRPNVRKEEEEARQAAVDAELRAGVSAKSRLTLVLRQYELMYAQLSAYQEEAASALGWSARTWDTGDLRPCRDRRWQTLSTQEKLYAEALYFSPATWSNAGACADQPPPRPRRDDMVAASVVANPVSRYSVGLMYATTASRLQEVAGRIVGLRNLPGMGARQILKAIRPQLCHRHSVQHIISTFRSLDRDQTGAISPAELRQGLCDLSIALSTQQCLDLLSIADDRAGAPEVVDYTKFARLLVPRLSADEDRALGSLRGALLRAGIDLGTALRHFDRNGDGWISRRELWLGLDDLRLGLSAQQLDRLVDAAESANPCTDGYGSIDYREFATVLGGSYARDQELRSVLAQLRDTFTRHGADLHEAFSAFDRDGRGDDVSFDEFAHGLRQSKIALTEKQIADVMQHLDKDNDGRICYSDFVVQFADERCVRKANERFTDEVRALVRQRRRSGHGDLTAVFHSGDGRLSKEAFRRGLHDAGLTEVRRHQINIAFVSLRPDAEGLISVTDCMRKFNAGAATTRQLRQLACYLCDQLRSSGSLSPYQAMGLARSDASRATVQMPFWSPAELRDAFKKLANFSHVRLDMLLDMLDSAGEGRVSKTDVRLFLCDVASFGAAREILRSFHEQFRALCAARDKSPNLSWLTPCEFCATVEKLGIRMRPDNVTRLAGHCTDGLGRLNWVAFLEQLSFPSFSCHSLLVDTGAEPVTEGGLVFLAQEIKLRLVRALNVAVCKVGDWVGSLLQTPRLLISADSLASCVGSSMHVNVKRHRLSAVASLCEGHFNYLAIASLLVGAGCDMASAAGELSEEIDAFVTLNEVDVETLFTVLDRKQKGSLSLRGFIQMAVAVGIQMRATRLMDAWSFLPQDSRGRIDLRAFVRQFDHLNTARRVRAQFAGCGLNCRAVFSQLDVNRTGAVLPDDLGAYLLKMHPRMVDVDVKEALVLDEHGAVPFRAFSWIFGNLRRTLITIKRALRSQRTSAMLAFCLGDAIGDAISPSQIRTGLRALGVELPLKDVDELIEAAMDSNRRVTCHGFVSMLGCWHAETSMLGLSKSIGAVQMFRQESRCLMKKQGGDAMRLFDLFARRGSRQLTREEFFAGFRHTHFQLPPQHIKTLWDITASFTKLGGRVIDRAGFAALYGRMDTVPDAPSHPDYRDKTELVTSPSGQVPGFVAPWSTRHTTDERFRRTLARVENKGKLSKTSWSYTMQPLRIPAKVQTALIKLFDAFDGDLQAAFRAFHPRGDTIFAADMQAGLTDLGLPLSRVEVENVMKSIMQRRTGATLSAASDCALDLPRYSSAVVDYNGFCWAVRSAFNSRRLSVAVIADIHDNCRRHGANIATVLKALHSSGDDGIIDLDELRRGLQQIGMHLSDSEVDSVVQHLDRDGNGQIRFVDFAAIFGNDSQFADDADFAYDHPEFFRANHQLDAPTQVTELTPPGLAQDEEAIAHILTQFAAAMGFLDNTRSKIAASLQSHVHDSHLPYDDAFISRRKEQQLWSMLDREERGHLTRSDFMQPPTLPEVFKIDKDDLRNLAFLLDFGSQGRLRAEDFFRQIYYSKQTDFLEYRATRREQPEGSELVVPCDDLAQILSLHCVDVDSIAMDTGLSVDEGFVRLDGLQHTLHNMGVTLLNQHMDILACLGDSRRGGVFLRDLGRMISSYELRNGTAVRCVPSWADELGHAILRRGVDMRLDVFENRAQLSSFQFRQCMRRIFESDVVPACINAATTALATRLNGEAQGCVLLQTVLKEFALPDDDTACRLSREGKHSLSPHLIRQAVRTACRSGEVAIELPYQGITDAAMQAWLGPHGLSLQEAGAITVLNLSHNTIGDTGASILARCIDSDSMITTVCLAYNHIGDAGAGSLALMLQGSTSLRSLDLGHNRIGKSGVLSLRRAASRQRAFPRCTLLLNSNNVLYDTRHHNMPRVPHTRHEITGANRDTLPDNALSIDAIRQQHGLHASETTDKTGKTQDPQKAVVLTQASRRCCLASHPLGRRKKVT